MKIFAILDNNSGVTNGCFHVRTHVPLMELKERGHQIEYASLEGDRWDEIKDADIVIFSRAYNRPFMGLLWRCKAAGIKVVYEIDDDVWNIPDTNPSQKSFENKYQQVIEDTILEADMVTVSTEPLKKMVSRLHDNVKVIPNALDLEKWGKRPNNEELNIGFSGGSNHLEDLLMIVDDIAKLQEKYDFKFILQGFVARPLEADGYEESLKNSIGFADEKDEKISSMKLELYRKLLDLKKFLHIPFYPPEMHPKVLQRADLDIGLMPVKGYKFDESKSIIKLLEYTAVGTTAIASNMAPYKNVAPYTIENDNWYEGIEKLILDEKLRKDILKKQEKVCFPTYSLKKVGDIWEKEFNNLIK
jgi:glycosyltransferase involved in cell wall biosynthesis